MKTKITKAWAIARIDDDRLLDDGEDMGDKTLIIYPIFKKKSDAKIYIQKTYTHREIGIRNTVAKVIPINLIPLSNE